MVWFDGELFGTCCYHLDARGWLWSVSLDLVVVEWSSSLTCCVATVVIFDLIEHLKHYRVIDLESLVELSMSLSNKERGSSSEPKAKCAARWQSKKSECDCEVVCVCNDRGSESCKLKERSSPVPVAHSKKDGDEVTAGNLARINTQKRERITGGSFSHQNPSWESVGKGFHHPEEPSTLYFNGDPSFCLAHS